jgi:predicted permease
LVAAKRPRCATCSWFVGAMPPEWIITLWLRILALFQREQFDADLKEEMRLHLELREREHLERGLSPREAHYAAQRRFGNDLVLRERSRDMWRWNWLEAFLQDVRYGLRQLRRNPGFTIVSVLTLALGIGANTAIFSIVDAVLLRPLPFRNADRLVFITQRSPKDRIGAAYDTYREFEEWNRNARRFEKLAATTWAPRDAGAILSWRGERQEILVVPATVNFFSTLGVGAAQGRTFETSDLKSPCTVVLAHQFWWERLSGAQDWVGKSLILNDKTCTVVGIMPKDFSVYPKQTQMWTLITPESAIAKNPWDMPVVVFGLLSPGVSRLGTQAELAGLENRIIGEKPDLAAMRLQPDVLGLRWMFDWLTGRNLRSSVLILFGAVVFVLLIACVNVANLLLGRALERQKELSVRAALGSGRRRLIRQLLTESIVLSAGGALLGALVAVCSLRYINATEATQLPPGNPVAVNWHVLSFVAILAVLTGLLFGLFPAWKSSRLDLNGALKESGPTVSRGSFGHRASRILVAAEITLSLVVLAAAALLIESLAHLTNAPLGFERAHLLTADVRLPSASYPKAGDWMRFWNRLGPEIASLPGVKGAAFAPALGAASASNPVTIQGTLSARLGHSIDEIPVSAGYFHVLGVPVLRGRIFDDRDRKGSMPAAIVNEAFVKEFFPKRDPLGHQIKLGMPGADKPWLTIVGVVGNVRHTTLYMAYAEAPYVYLPLPQDPQPQLSVFVRTAVSPASLERDITRTITMADSNLPRPQVQTLNQWLSWFTAEPRFRAELLGTFAALALLLAGVGIYGVLSQLVTQRTHEIGLRVALGAQKGDVLRMVVGQGFKLTLIGVGAGVIGALGLTRFLSSMLYGVKPADPLTFGAVSLIVIAVALLACYIPARRAAKVDPIVALRHE